MRRSRLALLYNDVDPSRFRWSGPERTAMAESLRRQHGLSRTATVILFVHRLSPVRRTLDYLPAALLHLRSEGLLDDVALLVVGGGSDAPKLKELCSAEGLDEHVRFPGEAANDGIESLYAAADVFIQPSHAEGFPRVLLEAMASGLPIVTTGAGGSGVVLPEQQQKYVTDPDEPAEFSAALAELMRSRHEWPTLSKENQAAVERFATPVVAAMYRKVLFG